MTNSQDRRRPQDRVLLVESDPEISDLIGRQALQGGGYKVQVAADGASAISRALQWSPDLMIVDLHLPGLSGKDLLVALAAQGITTPVIILARKGREADIIQTFRLGAADYLLLPARETEVVNAVNRVLRQVHDRRERERLAQQVEQANQELQARVRELTTIFALGKAMTSVTDQAALLDMILDGALRVIQADLAWLLLRDGPDEPFRVAAERGLVPALGARINQPWDDGVSPLVAMSGETLNIHGAALKRVKIAGLGTAALIVPIKVQKKVLGVLSMMRRMAVPGPASVLAAGGAVGGTDAAFNAGEQRLLEALADFASISLANVRLFRAAEKRVHALEHALDAAQVGEKIQNDLLATVRKELIPPVSAALAGLDWLVKDPQASWQPEQRQSLGAVHSQLLRIYQVGQSVEPLPAARARAELPALDLAKVLAHSLRRIQPFVKAGGLALEVQMPQEPVPVRAEGRLAAQAVNSLLAHAARYGSRGSQLVVGLEKTGEAKAHLWVRNSGWPLDKQAADALLEDGEAGSSLPPAQRFGGLAIRLSLVKEIIRRLDGKIWVESPAGTGTEIHVSLPMAR